MTLDEMIQETASYIDETLTKTNNQYTDVSTFNKLKSAINYAYKKICREKYVLEYSETVSNGSPLTKIFFRLISLKEAGTDNDIDYDIVGDNISYDYDGQADIVYNYIPEELSGLNDAPLLPEASVDHKILCYYAAFQYFNIDDDERAIKWLNLWNDGFENIKQIKTKITRIKNVYGGW